MMNARVMQYLIAATLCVTFPDIANSQDAQSSYQESAQTSTVSSQPATNLIEKLQYFTDGKVMSRSEFTSDGRLVARCYYYHDGQGKIRKEEHYDWDGNKVEESNYDSEGKLDDNIDGWAAKRWIYRNGVLRTESTYGEDGRLTETDIYNDQGDIVERKYAGDKLDQNEEFNRNTAERDKMYEFCDLYGSQAGGIAGAVDDYNDILYND